MTKERYVEAEVDPVVRAHQWHLDPDCCSLWPPDVAQVITDYLYSASTSVYCDISRNMGQDRHTNFFLTCVFHSDEGSVRRVQTI